VEEEGEEVGRRRGGGEAFLPSKTHEAIAN
jgi:hypothetical protein